MGNLEIALNQAQGNLVDAFDIQEDYRRLYEEAIALNVTDAQNRALAAGNMTLAQSNYNTALGQYNDSVVVRNGLHYAFDGRGNPQAAPSSTVAILNRADGAVIGAEEALTDARDAFAIFHNDVNDSISAYRDTRSGLSAIYDGRWIFGRFWRPNKDVYSQEWGMLKRVSFRIDLMELVTRNGVGFDLYSKLGNAGYKITLTDTRLSGAGISQYYTAEMIPSQAGGAYRNMMNAHGNYTSALSAKSQAETNVSSAYNAWQSAKGTVDSARATKNTAFGIYVGAQSAYRGALFQFNTSAAAITTARGDLEEARGNYQSSLSIQNDIQGQLTQAQGSLDRAGIDLGLALKAKGDTFKSLGDAEASLREADNGVISGKSVLDDAQKTLDEAGGLYDQALKNRDGALDDYDNAVNEKNGAESERDAKLQEYSDRDNEYDFALGEYNDSVNAYDGAVAERISAWEDYGDLAAILVEKADERWQIDLLEVVAGKEAKWDNQEKVFDRNLASWQGIMATMKSEGEEEWDDLKADFRLARRSWRVYVDAVVDQREVQWDERMANFTRDRGQWKKDTDYAISLIEDEWNDKETELRLLGEGWNKAVQVGFAQAQDELNGKAQRYLANLNRNASGKVAAEIDRTRGLLEESIEDDIKNNLDYLKGDWERNEIKASVVIADRFSRSTNKTADLQDRVDVQFEETIGLVSLDSPFVSISQLTDETDKLKSELTIFVQAEIGRLSDIESRLSSFGYASVSESDGDLTGTIDVKETSLDRFLISQVGVGLNGGGVGEFLARNQVVAELESELSEEGYEPIAGTILEREMAVKVFKTSLSTTRIKQENASILDRAGNLAKSNGGLALLNGGIEIQNGEVAGLINGVEESNAVLGETNASLFLSLGQNGAAVGSMAGRITEFENRLRLAGEENESLLSKMEYLESMISALAEGSEDMSKRLGELSLSIAEVEKSNREIGLRIGESNEALNQINKDSGTLIDRIDGIETRTEAIVQTTEDIFGSLIADMIEKETGGILGLESRMAKYGYEANDLDISQLNSIMKDDSLGIKDRKLQIDLEVAKIVANRQKLLRSFMSVLGYEVADDADIEKLKQLAAKVEKRVEEMEKGLSSYGYSVDEDSTNRIEDVRDFTTTLGYEVSVDTDLKKLEVTVGDFTGSMNETETFLSNYGYVVNNGSKGRVKDIKDFLLSLGYNSEFMATGVGVIIAAGDFESRITSFQEILIDRGFELNSESTNRLTDIKGFVESMMGDAINFDALSAPKNVSGMVTVTQQEEEVIDIGTISMVSLALQLEESIVKEQEEGFIEGMDEMFKEVNKNHVESKWRRYRKDGNGDWVDYQTYDVFREGAGSMNSRREGYVVGGYKSYNLDLKEIYEGLAKDGIFYQEKLVNNFAQHLQTEQERIMSELRANEGRRINDIMLERIERGKSSQQRSRWAAEAAARASDEARESAKAEARAREFWNSDTGMSITQGVSDFWEESGKVAGAAGAVLFPIDAVPLDDPMKDRLSSYYPQEGLDKLEIYENSPAGPYLPHNAVTIGNVLHFEGENWMDDPNSVSDISQMGHEAEHMINQWNKHPLGYPGFAIQYGVEYGWGRIVEGKNHGQAYESISFEIKGIGKEDQIRDDLKKFDKDGDGIIEEYVSKDDGGDCNPDVETCITK